MLYELVSPLYTVCVLMVLGGIVYSAKTFFDRKMASLEAATTTTDQAEA